MFGVHEESDIGCLVFVRLPPHKADKAKPNSAIAEGEPASSTLCEPARLPAGVYQAVKVKHMLADVSALACTRNISWT